MNTYTQKLDCIQDLLNCGLSQTEIVKKMYQAWNVKESKTLEMIKTVKAGRPEAGRADGPYFECAGKSDSIHYANSYTINQVNAMIVQGTQPKRNFRAPMTRLIVWKGQLNDGTENESCDHNYYGPKMGRHICQNLETYYVFTELSNDKTDRA